MWDVVLGIKVGETGRTIVVDQTGRLIAAPDISMVLRNTDLSKLSHIEAAKAMSGRDGAVRSFLATNLEGEDVLSTFAPINPLGWKLFVELPTREAHAPIYAALMRSAVILGVGLTRIAFRRTVSCAPDGHPHSGAAGGCRPDRSGRRWGTR